MSDLDHAKAQARAQFEHIASLVERLRVAEEQDANGGADETYAPREEIEQSPLSVMVRDGWRQPGGAVQDGPEEYEILLCTGGPAVRIRGTFNGIPEPETAELQYQDWGTPWTTWRGEDTPDDLEETLLAYARVFYWGE